MAFKDEWRPRIDGVDDADSSAVNEIAEEVIRLGREKVDLSNYYTKGEIDNFRIADEMNMERHVGLRLDESLGNISTALDELHAYAQALKGGGAE
jgi:hypothetical protein